MTDTTRRSAETLASSLVLGALTGADGVVTHVGSHRGAGRDTGCLFAATALAEAMSLARRTLVQADSPLTLPRLLLETGAGGGNGISGRLEDLAVLVATVPEEIRKAVGICIDTAHLHAAGYRLDEEAGLEKILRRLAELDLFDRLGLVHLNDSASLRGSRQDRHENPGDGRIGYEALARVVRHPALASIPFVLETPGLEGHGPDAVNVAVVKAMRAGKSRTAAWRDARAAQPDGASTQGRGSRSADGASTHGRTPRAAGGVST